MSNTIKFQGKEYPTKQHDGYVFSVESLCDVLIDENGNYKTEGCESIDSNVAYFFDDDTFNSHSAEELHDIFEQHS